MRGDSTISPSAFSVVPPLSAVTLFSASDVPPYAESADTTISRPRLRSLTERNAIDFTETMRTGASELSAALLPAGRSGRPNGSGSSIWLSEIEIPSFSIRPLRSGRRSDARSMSSSVSWTGSPTRTPRRRRELARALR